MTTTEPPESLPSPPYSANELEGSPILSSSQTSLKTFNDDFRPSDICGTIHKSGNSKQEKEAVSDAPSQPMYTIYLRTCHATPRNMKRTNTANLPIRNNSDSSRRQQPIEAFRFFSTRKTSKSWETHTQKNTQTTHQSIQLLESLTSAGSHVLPRILLYN